MKHAHVLEFAAAALLVTAAAPAPAPVVAGQPAEAKSGDSSEVICEKQQITGSRLVAKRVCKTRAQWADDKLQDRQDLEKVQVQRSIRQ